MQSFVRFADSNKYKLITFNFVVASLKLSILNPLCPIHTIVFIMRLSMTCGFLGTQILNYGRTTCIMNKSLLVLALTRIVPPVDTT